jgi:site-specific DNA-methyltransferase (adenine-specific)
VSRVERIGSATLYLADCLDVLPALSEVGAAFTSPPYNLGQLPWKGFGHWRPGKDSGGRGKWRAGCNSGLGAGYSEHDDAMPWAEYVGWQKRVLTELWRIVSPAGAIFYNHKPRVIGSRLWVPTELLPDEVHHRQTVIWARPGGQNFNATAFVPTHEWLMMLAHPSFRLKSRGASGAGDVWQIAPERNPHPAPFPVELPRCALEAIDADTVLDPFMGSGTTGLACAMLGKSFIGIERDPIYFEMACERLSAIERQPGLFAA